MATQRCRVIAHRGASGRKRENTLAAFTLAYDLRADLVELDARRTCDGVIVVHHDARLVDGRVIVELNADALPAYVPSLAAALNACRPMGVNVEIKNVPGEPDHDADHRHLAAIVAIMSAVRPADELLVSSFDETALLRLRVIAPQFATALLTYELADPRELVERAVANGHLALHPFDATVDAALVVRAHHAGLMVNVWTVDDPQRMRELISFGVDGICTNLPDVARAVVDAVRE